LVTKGHVAGKSIISKAIRKAGYRWSYFCVFSKLRMLQTFSVSAIYLIRNFFGNHYHGYVRIPSR
jgi:hypothetical protein